MVRKIPEEEEAHHLNAQPNNKRLISDNNLIRVCQHDTQKIVLWLILLRGSGTCTVQVHQVAQIVVVQKRVQMKIRRDKRRKLAKRIKKRFNFQQLLHYVESNIDINRRRNQKRTRRIRSQKRTKSSKKVPKTNSRISGIRLSVGTQELWLLLKITMMLLSLRKL